MKKILAATDFSARSDRAIRRSTLLAKTFDASVTLVHAVDDDQPQRVVRAEHRESLEVLGELSTTLRNTDQISCDSQVILGDPFQGITRAADEMAADIIVMGEHRRQILRDVFTGTTVERTIRNSRLPVLMVAAVPSQAYRHVLIAVDFSNVSDETLQSIKRLGLDKHANISVLHVYDAIGRGLMSRASLHKDEIDDYIQTERERANRDFSEFLQKTDIQVKEKILKLNESSVASVICSTAQEVGADLIVVGTQSRFSVEKLLLGSVAEGVLRTSKSDVLTIPQQEKR